MSIIKSSFGSLPDGSHVDLFTLDNGKGLQCKIMTLGGIVTELWVPDKDGHKVDVVLGFSSLEAYVEGHPHFGALTGRVAGRINAGRFELDGKTYQLACNDFPNHLHGGPIGIDKHNWQAEPDDNDPENPSLLLRTSSPDGDMGYPGNLDITVIYTLTADNALKIDYAATSDAPTPLSLTNHAYFNLAGEGSTDLSGHTLQIFSDTIVPKLADGTLTDQPTPVVDTLHDFRSAKDLTAFAGALEHGEHYVLRAENIAEPELSAELIHLPSGRKMAVATTATAVQLYVSQTLGQAEAIGKSGKPYFDYSAVCLECQGYPNGVNCPEIDDIILRPGETYHQCTTYTFSCM
jgi:aldose 1-epimerase